jgi:hypothetical protein
MTGEVARGGDGVGARERWKTYPDVEIEVFVCYGFDVEAYCWYCGDYLADLGWCVSWFGTVEAIAWRICCCIDIRTGYVYVPSVCIVMLSCLHCPDICNQHSWFEVSYGNIASYKTQNQYPYLFLCPYELCEC